MTRIRNLAVIALLVVSTIVVGAVGWNVNALVLRLRKTADAVQPGLIKIVNDAERTVAPLPALVEKNTPRISQTIQAGELATLDAQQMLKVQRREWESPEYIRWRQHGFRAGEQATIAIAHLTDQTLPRIDRTIDEFNARFNGELLPEATRTLVALRSTAEIFQADGQAILKEILQLAQKGEVSLDQVNRTLSSDAWLKILANVERSTSNIADTTAQLPATAASIEKILRTASAYQKPILIAQILATLARVLFP